MEYQFRNEVRDAKKAAMGEMFNLAKQNLKPGEKIINFASGHPSTEVFEDSLIKKYLTQTMVEADKELFQYGAHAGYMPLRKTLKKFINEKGDTVKETDDLIITYGAVEAIYLSCSALIKSGDKIIVEVPSYVNAIKSFQIQGAEIIGVHLDNDGVDLNEKGSKVILYGT